MLLVLTVSCLYCNEKDGRVANERQHVGNPFLNSQDSECANFMGRGLPVELGAITDGNNDMNRASVRPYLAVLMYTTDQCVIVYWIIYRHLRNCTIQRQ